jgi:hypothetical protein
MCRSQHCHSTATGQERGTAKPQLAAPRSQSGAATAYLSFRANGPSPLARPTALALLLLSLPLLLRLSLLPPAGLATTTTCSLPVVARVA